MDDSLDNTDELAGRLKQGDHEALALLFSQHRDRLWRLVRFRMDRRLLGRVDPEDVLQEGYLAAAQRLPHYKSDSTYSPFVWLRMVLLQTLTDIHRYHLGAQMRDADREVGLARGRNACATSASLAIELVGKLTSPSQAAARSEMARQVEQAVDAMEEIDREILTLRHFEELSNREIAEVLGIQQKAASIRYVRAIKRLRGILAEQSGLL